MRKPKANPDSTPTTHFFARELPGENPPSFSTLETLYELAYQLYALIPWHILDEGELVLVRNPANGEMCYCSVMGSLGEVLALHAYLGDESYRLFRNLADSEDNVEEFLESNRRVALEFVSSRDLDAQDKKLLTALGHPLRKAQACPIFRSGRPGFHAWFVTEEEALLLIECTRAMLLICSEVSTKQGVDYWAEEDFFPLVTHLAEEGTKSKFHVELIEAPLPEEPAPVPVSLSEEQLTLLRHKDYPVGGVLELDYIVDPMPIGTRYERKSFTRIALAVDGKTGMVLQPEIASPGASPGQALVEVILKAIKSTRAIPSEVRVQNKRFKANLEPLASVCGFPVKVVRSLPALSAARAALLDHLERMG